ncbi:hypothetical protein [Pseudomonas sp. ES3-33]|uniref:hypothetical protein n=1 Tax=Pseudomonas sp. ES3-33 TaxID=1628833 RepID=UPI0005D3D201|nr:hypothetical protein [Pseudomonas sp. ES3-33]KJH75633.1 hypothetical protein UB23_18100 [Pseudomonas sp. ES3-33]
MAKQTILLGAAPTGVGGDTPRTAFTKAQQNFDELYARDAQLGSAANANIGTALGNVMAVGAFGIGSAAPAISTTMNEFVTQCKIVTPSTQYVSNLPGLSYGTRLDLAYPGSTLGSQIMMGISPGNIIGFRSGDYATAAFNIIYHTGNTTRAADGTLKAI